MKIENYKYNEQTFEKDAYELMLKREEADKNLKLQEKLIKKNVNNVSLSYYKAYLNYMHDSNEHTKSFLAFLKHEYEMLRRTAVLFFNDDEMLKELNELIQKTKTAFKFYIRVSIAMY